MQARDSAQITNLAAFTDVELVRMTLQRNESAFRVIMQRHNRRLYRCARSLVRDDAEAEDIVQETYVNAFGKLASFRGESSLATWLTRIALNEALGRVRRRRRMVELGALDAAGPGTAQIIPFSHTDPERTTAQREMRRLIERAIDDLPELFRVVFVMRDVEGMSIEETAAFLSVRPATVKTRLHRARRLLRRALDEQLATALVDAFPFDGAHCARVSDAVLDRLGFLPSPAA